MTNLCMHTWVCIEIHIVCARHSNRGVNVLQALHGGARPSLAVLDRLLACLREPRPQPGAGRFAGTAPAQPSVGVSTFTLTITLTRRWSSCAVHFHAAGGLAAAC